MLKRTESPSPCECEITGDTSELRLFYQGEQRKDGKGNRLEASNPDWPEIRTWARNMARKMVRNMTFRRITHKNRKKTDETKRRLFWEDELTSAAICCACECWHRYGDRPESDFHQLLSTSMYRAIIGTLRDERARGVKFTSLDGDADDDDENKSTARDALELRCLEDMVHDGGIQKVEDSIDFDREWVGYFDELTASESAVVRERCQNPSAKSDEVAPWANVSTGGAVRLHEANARKKLKSFINNRLNKFDGKSIW